MFGSPFVIKERTAKSQTGLLSGTNNECKCKKPPRGKTEEACIGARKDRCDAALAAKECWRMVVAVVVVSADSRALAVLVGGGDALDRLVCVWATMIWRWWWSECTVLFGLGDRKLNWTKWDGKRRGQCEQETGTGLGGLSAEVAAVASAVVGDYIGRGLGSSVILHGQEASTGHRRQ